MSENIPYIIAEDGYYYVAYKEKVKVPEIVVSAKGVANGLSEEYNDGWDFGPDSYSPTSTSAVPYTESTGILEAWNYAVSVAVLNSTTGNYVIPEIRFVGSPFYINTNITFSGSGKYIENLILKGESSMAPYLVCNINSGYAITLDGDTFRDTNIRFENLQPAVGSGYTPAGFLYTFSGTAGPGNVFEGYNIDISNSGWTEHPLYLGQMEGIYMNNYETYVSDSVGYFAASSWITFVSGMIPGGTSIYFNGVGSTSSYGAPTVSMISVNSLMGSQGQGIIIYTDSLATLTIIGSMFLGQINISDAIAVTAGFTNTMGSITLIDVYISMQTLTAFINATSSQSLLNLFISTYVIRLLNSPATTINFMNNVSIAGISKVSIASIQLNSNVLTSYPSSATPSISANPPVSGTVYQNTNPYDIEIDLPAYASTSGTAGYVTVAKGSTDTPTAIANQYVSGDTSSSAVDIVRLRVPAGWYYEFTASGVTFGTASVFAD